MDIVIRNGKIDGFETNKKNEIKNENGLLKKDYKDFNADIPGPYYDLYDTHLHIPRKSHLIKNFQGPQLHNRLKLNNNSWNNNDTFCSICHCLIKKNPSFVAKRTITVYYDEYERKVDNLNSDIDGIGGTLKKIKLNPEDLKCEDLKCEDGKYDKSINIDMSSLTITLSAEQEQINEEKRKHKIYNNFHVLVNKILQNSLFYPISNKETRLIKPWNLTRYQKFKLLIPDYKNSCIFIKPDKIDSNYITIN